ncbi:DMT family transporter [Nostoc sp. CHAB 5715]|uniref:DMT family transporter n=1 Tax=Nostoc sp. CHAB 5715 TaxID=2780400 RepID=UPI001E3AB10C|nr:DMT family transporter [Nostoc sp. CHAB 5715]
MTELTERALNLKYLMLTALIIIKKPEENDAESFNFTAVNQKELKIDKGSEGIVYMVIAAFCFSVSGACTRVLGKDISSVELVFFRNCIGVIFIFYSVNQRPLVQIGGKPFLLIFRGITGTLALYTFFYSITKIGLGVAITYQQSYPVFLAVFSAVYLKEKMKPKEWIAVIIGFAGICLIFLPQISIDIFSLKNHSIGLLNAVLTALAYLSIKGLSKIYDSRSIVLSFMLSGILLPVFSLMAGYYIESDYLGFLVGKFTMPDGIQWVWIWALSISALIGQIYLTKAFTYGKVGPVSAMGYSNIVFSVFFGVLLGDAIPHLTSFMGIALIIFCGVVIAYSGSKVKEG